MASGAILSSKAGALDAQQTDAHDHAANAALAPHSPQQDISGPDVLLLKDYHPRSIFKIPVTRVEKARYPVIDVHNHGVLRGRWSRDLDQNDGRREFREGDHLHWPRNHA